MRVDTLENELVKEIVVFRSEVEGFKWLAIEDDLQRSEHIGRTELRGEQQGAEGHDGGLRGTPSTGGLFL
jgi:hypothetical protein